MSTFHEIKNKIVIKINYYVQSNLRNETDFDSEISSMCQIVWPVKNDPFTIFGEIRSVRFDRSPAETI